MSVAGSTSSQGTHSRSPSRSRSPPYSDGRYPPSSSNTNTRYRYDYSNYNRLPRSGMSADLDNYRDLRDRERDRERDRDRMGLMREDRYNPRGRERDRDDRYAPYYREEPPHHYASSSSSSNMMPRDYSKLPTPLRRDVSSDPTKDLKLSTNLLNKDQKDDTNKPPSTPTSSEPPPPPSSSSSYAPSNRYNNEWRDTERDRERHRRYREEDRRRDYDRRRDGYMRDMRYESSSYGPPSLSSNYQMSSFGGGDSYRPDRDRDRDVPPSPGGHLAYYERDRLDDRDYYGRGPSRNSGGNSGIAGGPMSDYDRYRAGSGRGRPTWGPKDDSNRRLLDRDRPERITTSNMDMTRSGRTSPTSYSATSTPTKDRLPISATFDIIKPDESSKKEASETSTQLNEEKVEEKDISNIVERVASPPNTTTKDNTTEETAGLEKGEVVEPEEPSTAMEQDKLEPIPKTDSSEPMQLVTEKEEPEAAVKQEPGTKHEQDSASSISLQPPPPPPPPSKSLEDGEKEEGETTTDAEPTVNMTQEQIVERIDDIENQISTYEEMLEAAIKREEEEASSSAAAITTTTQVDDEDVEMADDEDETAEEEASQNKAEAKKQALQAMENEPNSSSTDVMDFTDATSPIMRKRPQLLINQLRAKNDHLDDELYEKILQDNRQVAKQNTSEGLWQGHKENMEDWIDEEKWSKPLYSRLEDYPCYKENIAQFEQLRISVAHTMHTQHVALQNKERFLKKEFKALYNQWNDKNLALDRVRMHERKGSDKYGGHRTSSRRREEPEEYTDNVIFTSGAPDALRFKADGASTPHGLYTSDAARSEAELLEIIQSLESAEMRNPETRAKKTTATIPPMILDVRERMRTYDDRSGLVEDPLTYYHTGPDTGDVWNQQEVTTFMESYMMYPKQFERISIAIGTKTACQCVLFYYRKKKKIDFKALMKKGRRGKTTKHRDRIAAAIRAVTGDSASTTRKAKSKGSALMTDIGEAQVSRMAKEKDAERKSRELRDLEQANAYWDGVAERKKTKRPSSSNVTSNSASSVNVPPMSTPIVYPGQNDYNSNVLSRGSVIANSAPSSSASDDTEMMLQQQQLQQQQQEKRRTNSGSLVTGQQRRKGRLPREPAQPPTDVVIVLPSEPTATKKYVADEFMDTTADDSSASVVSSSTKWTEREKEIVIEAFKQYGRDFTQVSSLVHTKTEDQCRNFYHNFKRKYGPNAFNEEDGRASATAATESAPSQQPRPPIQTAPAAIVHDEVVALSGRTDLKAEEEDAAAALVGMFQMGANTTPREESAKNPLLTSRSRTPSSGQQLQEDLVRTQTVSATPTAASATVSAGPSSPITSSPYVPPTQQQQQQQRRRRVRSTSSRAESATGGEDSASSDWTAADADYGGPRSGGRKLGRTATLAETKRPAYSSYWSVSERNDFARYLGLYGKDWDKLANAMKSKTVIQVRNFYANNEEKMGLKDIANRYNARRKQEMPLQQQPIPPSTQQPAPPPQPKREIPSMGTSFDTSAAHFQALQNFPFPAPIVDQQPIVTSSPHQPPPPPLQAHHRSSSVGSNTKVSSPYANTMNRTGYYSPTPPSARITPSSSSSEGVVYSGSRSYSPSQHHPQLSSRPLAQAPPRQPLLPHQQLHHHQQQQQQQQQPQAQAQPQAEAPSAVTKVADLLNNDDPAEPNQNSWETWFGS